MEGKNGRKKEGEGKKEPPLQDILEILNAASFRHLLILKINIKILKYL